MSVLTPVISFHSTSTTISELTFDWLPSIPKIQVSFCARHIKNIMNVYMIEADDSLNPDDSGSSLVVSSYSLMANSGICFVLVGSCAKYCTDVDMDKLGVKTESPIVAFITNERLDNSPTVDPISLDPNLCLSNDNLENDQNNWYVLDAKRAIVEDRYNVMRIFKRQHQSRGGLL